MDKSICTKPLNRKPLISSTNINHSQYEIPQSATKNNENNIIDYRNISLTLTGEISSSSIHRDNLTQKQPNVMLVEDIEDDDEQFISNMKNIIDKNYKTQNKENHIRDLQSKSYLSKKKKCVFSDEDQNLMKRFKRSVNESKVLHATSQKLQQSVNANTSISNSKSFITTTTPKTTSTVALSKIDTDFNRNDTNQSSFHIISQKNDQLMPRNTGIVTQTEITEIEQIFYCELQYLTPPKTNE